MHTRVPATHTNAPVQNDDTQTRTGSGDDTPTRTGSGGDSKTGGEASDGGGDAYRSRQVLLFRQAHPLLPRSLRILVPPPVFKAHGLVYHSTLGLRVIKTKKQTHPPNFETPNPETQTQNPRSETRNPKLEAPSEPEPVDRTPKPKS